jgi:hypothetical protein
MNGIYQPKHGKIGIGSYCPAKNNRKKLIQRVQCIHGLDDLHHDKMYIITLMVGAGAANGIFGLVVGMKGKWQGFQYKKCCQNGNISC